MKALLGPIIRRPVSKKQESYPAMMAPPRKEADATEGKIPLGVFGGNFKNYKDFEKSKADQKKKQAEVRKKWEKKVKKSGKQRLLKPGPKKNINTQQPSPGIGNPDRK